MNPFSICVAFVMSGITSIVKDVVKSRILLVVVAVVKLEITLVYFTSLFNIFTKRQGLVTNENVSYDRFLTTI